MSDCGCEMEARNQQQRATLWLVLAINGLMFLVEFVLGVVAQSTGLIADSMDMLADASVYGISLYAVGKSLSLKRNAAMVSGIGQVLLVLLVMADVVRRFIVGSEPVSFLIIGVGSIALVANVICFVLIAKHRDQGVHMRASYIFSRNDVIVNLGVIFSGVMIWLWGSRYPDLIIGAIIAAIVLRGGWQIIKEARHELAELNS